MILSKNWSPRPGCCPTRTRPLTHSHVSVSGCSGRRGGRGGRVTTSCTHSVGTWPAPALPAAATAAALRAGVGVAGGRGGVAGFGLGRRGGAAGAVEVGVEEVVVVWWWVGAPEALRAPAPRAPPLAPGRPLEGPVRRRGRLQTKRTPV